MLARHVALVSEKSRIRMRELSAVAAALQKQATRDLGPIWEVESTVTAFEKLEDLPLDYWPVIVKDDIGDPNAAGYHEDENGQPFSLVEYSRGWSLTASHEVLEMLVDPFGRRLVAGESPMKGQGRVRFLVEVCDPSEAEKYAYHVNGVRVSDFYTPHYFDPKQVSGVRYSFTEAITAPKQVLPGGYLSWYDSEKREWWQRTWFGAKPSDNRIDGFRAMNGNLRQALDRYTEAGRARATGRPAPIAKGAKRVAMMRVRARDAGDRILTFPNRAQSLRETIAAVTGRK
jgi:hypothetical protein